jgi:hypothetical protein
MIMALAKKSANGEIKVDRKTFGKKMDEGAIEKSAEGGV